MLSSASTVGQALPWERWHVLRFGCVGFTGFVINSAMLWLLTEHLHLYYLTSSVLACEVAIISNFTLNHFWTFASVRDTEPLLAKLAKFNLVSLGGLLLTVGTLFAVTRMTNMHYMVANVLAVGSGFGWNYFMNRRWTWPGSSTGERNSAARGPL